jgi:acyl-CoA synthetase (NDP forming)
VYVAVQADAVLDVVKAAARKGTGALAILSSGFGETEDGIAAQRELVTICDTNDIALCGPNCLGLITFWVIPRCSAPRCRTACNGRSA